MKRASFLSVRKHAASLIESLIECRPQNKLVIVEQEAPESAQKNPQERSPLTIDENTNDPYNLLLLEMVKGNIKVSYKDFLKVVRTKYPKREAKTTEQPSETS